MSWDLNSVNVTGNLVKDPVESTSKKTGDHYVRVRIAVNQGEKTDFINCQAYGQSAEHIMQYCHQGDKIGVTGSINTWEHFSAVDGTKSSYFNIRVYTFAKLATAHEKKEERREPSDL